MKKKKEKKKKKDNLGEEVDPDRSSSDATSGVSNIGPRAKTGPLGV